MAIKDSARALSMVVGRLPSGTVRDELDRIEKALRFALRA